MVEQKLLLDNDLQCYHCGESCTDRHFGVGNKNFCCRGCQTVYELLRDNNLTGFYQQRESPGKSTPSQQPDRYAALEQPEILDQLLDFRENKLAKVTFSLPQIHCSACIWLLEKLYRLHPGILACQVNFLRKEACISFDPDQITLRKLAEILAGIGYAPDFNLSDLDRNTESRKNWKLLYQIGVAGFAFGNSMLFSFPEYLGLDPLSETYFRSTFGYLNLALAIPVVLYSAQDYLRAAKMNLASKTLTIDFPITLGILSLLLRSAWEIITQSGAGYLDSLTGLVFFLLIGRWFQQKTYHRLTFDRDYQAYFPLAVRLQNGTTRAVRKLEVGDIMLIRHGELLPADGHLLQGNAYLDYSFVTGEAMPVRKNTGDQLYSGGRQIGEQIQVKINRPIAQSYLTRLWDQEAFRKDKDRQYQPSSNRIGKYFTISILSIALISMLYWLPQDAGTAVNVFTAVLIIACPCAIALTVPFTLGSALRMLGKAGLFVKNTHVIERIRNIDSIVFDKTGTLTESGQNLGVSYTGRPLTGREKRSLFALCQQSSHPMARAVGEWAGPGSPLSAVENFRETTGRGLSAIIEQHKFQLGSANYLGVDPLLAGAGQVFLSIDDEPAGSFIISNRYRHSFAGLIRQLEGRFELFLLSGDNSRESSFLNRYFPADHMHFQQSPQEKLDFIRALQQQGKKVLMIGDGLNDAGALQQSEVGLVISEDANNFTPACDAILDAGGFSRIPRLLDYARRSNFLVGYAYVLAIIYNVIGLSFAVQALLSPVVAAILMPLSSITIVTFGVLSSRWLALRKIPVREVRGSGGSRQNGDIQNDDLYHDKE